MNDADGIAGDVTPEEREWASKANAEMDRRIRDGVFAQRPMIREKMDSIAPGVHVTRDATKPAEPLRGEEPADSDDDG